MSILRVLRANRLAVLLGSGLICTLGFMTGCDNDSATTSPAAQKENQAKQEEQANARKQAYGKTGNPSSIPAKGALHKTH